MMFDVCKKRVYVPPYPKSKDTMLTVKAKGGVLADQMGLGKTITLLALFAKNAPTDSPVPDPDSTYSNSTRAYTSATCSLLVQVSTSTHSCITVVLIHPLSRPYKTLTLSIAPIPVCLNVTLQRSATRTRAVCRHVPRS